MVHIQEASFSCHSCNRYGFLAHLNHFSIEGGTCSSLEFIRKLSFALWLSPIPAAPQVWCLFLLVNLTASGRKYNLKMDGTLVRFSAWTEVSESNSSSDLSGRKTHAFHLDLKTGRHVIWQCPAAGMGSSQLPAPQILKLSTNVRHCSIRSLC